ncbi:hypothetical protein [Photorhabdus aegyptia]|uniref:Uncharacterized protein n=1 Tax=Photorhabdus aegyptia TaxID=2805098 RepID=A0A022PD18_9GAMM|nr:hypothetical protein [Photorhabdus aegyptia]EYU13414.1 hypothetical protein BA1DRAFT_04101 [Photorhabdus aegyptia]
MLESTLLNLIEAINSQTFKSKQACFDYYLDDLLAVKKYYSWQNIADHINFKTKESLSLETYKVMLKKAKSRKKHSSNKGTTNNVNNLPKAHSEAKKIIRTPYDLKQLRKQSINLEELQNLSGDKK